MHGSRSGIKRSINDEFNSLANYGGITDLGFNASIGEDKVGLHLNCSHWGWNARKSSPFYLAVEFAQPFLDGEVNDAMVRAFVIWFRDFARVQWPNLPAYFPAHSTLDGTLEYGYTDGKTDIWPKNDLRLTDLINRINAHLDFFGIYR